MKPTRSISIANQVDSLPLANALIDQFCRRHALAAELEQTLMLLCEEVLCNTISHGYPDGSRGRIQLELYRDRERVTLRFEDDGIAFDPTSQPEAQLGLPIAEAPIGGLGLAMIKQLSDETHYQRQGKYNILTLSCNATSQRDRKKT